MESLNVKKGFQSIIDAYLDTLIQFKEKKEQYLVNIDSPGKFTLNFQFFKALLRNLLPEETDYIAHNEVYNTYIDAGKIKYVFPDASITMKTIEPIVREFKDKYNNFKHAIQNRRSLDIFLDDEEFMDSLKKST